MEPSTKKICLTSSKTSLEDAYREIFKYLPHKDLLNATLVCKTWNNWISNSKIFKSSTKLVFKEEEGAAEEVKLERLYESISFNRRSYRPIKKISSKILNQISLFNETVKEVDFWYFQFCASDFLNLLRSCSKIKILTLCDCEFERDSEHYEKVALSSMDEFVFNTRNSDWILDFLECKRVKKLSFCRSCSKDEVVIPPADHYIEFLNQIEDEVKKLRIMNINISNSNTELNPKFKWNKLSLQLDCYYTTVSMSLQLFGSAKRCNLEKLCNASEENSWLKLCICESHENSNHLNLSVVPCLINWSIGIITLEMLYACIMPQREEFLSMITKYSKVKNLKIYQGYDATAPLNLRSFITKFNHIDSLEVDASVLRKLDVNLTRLNYQNVTKFILRQYCSRYDSYCSLDDSEGKKLMQIVFPHIETLEIYGEPELLNYEAFEILQCFDRNNPTLRNFRIAFANPHSQAKLEEILIKAFAAMAHVKSFEIEADVWRDGKREWRGSPLKHLYLKATRSEISQKYFGNPSLPEEASHFLAVLMNRN